MPASHRLARSTPRRAAALPCLALAVGLGWAHPGRAEDGPSSVVRSGMQVELSLQQLEPGPPHPLQEGDQVEVRFRLTDAASGRPLPGVKPGAWIDVGGPASSDEERQRACKDRVGLYLKGVVGFRPLVDLNGSYLLVLNEDPSVSVIDPMVSMTGRTSLFATVVLKRPPADWVRTPDSKRLYVSTPKAGEVAVVDAEAFKVLASVEAGEAPVRLALQPDGRRLWVGNDATAAARSGVTVLDVDSLAVVARLPTGRGHHELAFSADGRRAFVTNRDQGTVTVLDTRTLKKVKTLATGPVPISVATSPLSGATYVADARTGIITAVDPERLQVVARLQARPGLGPLRFTQDGRWGLAVNPAEHSVVVVDASRNTLVHTLTVPGQPYQVIFTRAFAYLRLLDSARVVMINLSSLGAGRTPIVQGFEAGAGAPQQAGTLSIADSVAQASLDAAVYVVNPADDTISFYMEGMNAPMGSYGAYGHAAGAVMVLDRSLKEEAPGVYAGRLRLPAPGRYDVAFLTEDPRVLHCFSAEVAPNPALQEQRGALAVRFLDTPARASAGAALPLRFQLLDPATRQPRAGLADVRVLGYLAPGQLRTELSPVEVEPGTYQVTASLARPGAWYFHVVVPSLSVGPSDLPFHSVIAEAPARPAPSARP